MYRVVCFHTRLITIESVFAFDTSVGVVHIRVTIIASYHYLWKCFLREALISQALEYINDEFFPQMIHLAHLLKHHLKLIIVAIQILVKPKFLSSHYSIHNPLINLLKCWRMNKCLPHYEFWNFLINYSDLLFDLDGISSKFKLLENNPVIPKCFIFFIYVKFLHV